MKMGKWGENIKSDLSQVKLNIEKEIGFSLSVMNPASGLYGLDFENCILDARMIEAASSAFKISKVLSNDKVKNKKVCEIGAGLGWSAYYATKAGIKQYSLYDLPFMNVLSSYTLLKTVGDNINIVLSGEDASHNKKYHSTIHIKNADDFFTDNLESFDLLFNQDSFPEIGMMNFHNYISKYSEVLFKSGKSLILSINQESKGKSGTNENQLVVNKEMKEYSNIMLRRRHAYWLRPGYVEELFEISPQKKIRK